MVFKNLLRRPGRTILTVLGISIGVSAIIALGALADGLEVGYGSVLSGTDADFVLTDPEAFDIILSSVPEDMYDELVVMPEVSAVSPLLQGLVNTDESPYFFVFGYPTDSFVLDRFQIVEGVGLNSRGAEHARGTPLILGSAAAESFSKNVGDTIKLSDLTYRVVGIYETGDAFEEGGAVMALPDAQILLGLPRQVSVYYIQIKEPALAERFETRITRLYPDLSVSASEDLEESSGMAAAFGWMVFGVAALAIVIGGVGMMNAQLMGVFERTREIGVLRAVGWKRRRIMLMILGESILTGGIGGLVGVGLSYLALFLLADFFSIFGATITAVRPSLLMQAFITVVLLGIVGGLYPAYRASRLEPVEALRYEGGSGGDGSRLPVGGMALQNLWRRKARTFLTLGVIGLTVGSIMALSSIMRGTTDSFTDFVGGAEIMVRQAEAADTSVAFIEERIGDRIAAMDGIESVSGMLFGATASEESGMFLMLGYNPREPHIQQYRIVEGERINTNRQIMLGKSMAEAQNLSVGDTITLGDTRYSIVGIYESSTGWEEMGGIVTLRDAQTFTGRQRKVTFFVVDVVDPRQAEAIVDEINNTYPEVHASLAGDFADQLPDFENSIVMTNVVTLMAMLVGGVGMMNAMLMAVLERTREIGVLRALGWKRRAILSLIMRESLALGIIGAIVGGLLAYGVASWVSSIPVVGDALIFSWALPVFTTAIGVALGLSTLGGLYPAFRATRLEPVEALQYE